MSTDRLPPPCLSATAAAELAATWLEGPLTVTPLDSYLDANFLVDGADGRFVLKVAHASETAADLERQGHLLACLAEALPGIAPTPVGAVRMVRGEDGQEHAARIVTFLAGEVLASHLQTADEQTWETLGTLLARVNHALSPLEGPIRPRDFRWDLRQCAWITHASRDLWHPHRRALVQEASCQFLGAALPRLQDLPCQWIHHDANEGNLIARTVDGRPHVTGIFDFGDIIHAPRILEVAVAAAYAFIAPLTEKETVAGVGTESDIRMARVESVLRAYHAVTPLQWQELEVLFAAMRMRLAVSVTISTLGAQAAEENPHIVLSEQAAWRGLELLGSCNPAEVTRRFADAISLEHEQEDEDGLSRTAILEARKRHTSPSLSISYDEPITMVDGHASWLFDDQGRAFLDGVNNVCHVGHCHPKVVAAATRQLARLNTNTRYLHPHLARYTTRLAALFPAPLEVCFLVNSGSEANELALRLARQATGRQGVVALEGGYHGNTGGLIDVSHYKFAGQGGAGPPEHVRVAPCPDPYRGKHRGVDSGPAYAAEVRRALTEIHAAAFLFEPLVGCGGQVVPPAGFLTEACQAARDAGALVIADEVQVGFGRVGSHWWAHQLDDAAGGAQPDIVTLGKPIGNGFPMAAVVTTRAIAEGFANGMEFFNTFGGNPVACAVGLAVLDVIEEEDLRGRALRIGERMRTGLRSMQEEFPVIGDVRGAGLYLGAEFVRDRTTREPDAARLHAVLEACRESGLLFSSDGPDHNVLKIKPPIVWTEAEADLSLAILRRALEQTA